LYSFIWWWHISPLFLSLQVAGFLVLLGTGSAIPALKH